MVRVRYTGINDPEAVFERFRPVRMELCQLKLKCFPFHADYNALAAAIAGLDAAAIHFTKNPHFYVPEFKHPCFYGKDKGEEYPKG
jgi:hypothetical protein